MLPELCASASDRYRPVITTLAWTGMRVQTPNWSPDGTMIAFSRRLAEPHLAGGDGIVALGRRRRRLVRAAGCDHAFDLAEVLGVHPAETAGHVQAWSADPSTIELELTESTMIADPARSKLVVEELASIGLRLAIDDYGSGYSSLGYLTRLPISTIKIDRSFVMTMNHDEGNATIVRSTIELARNLGLDIVAEGVESSEVWHRLGTLGCTYAQGYYIAAPQPASELRYWLREHRGLGPVAESAA